ncbi:Gfo/Idh/MocA family oxidoreductase [Micromonospora sp. DR5-3]|uniref:Gfo/Idh/MocA family protein n=1 Tax=unclassified Micromonospora TaxID=2617518 RepID=UPI0011D3D32C|nr:MULTISPECIES: Gfo/Idh/MocA family oxidoreductase [unclassified Micromonospora]MCW3816366.1 Gfo/Idh/MocA family oxidoreductase [Micromonospora sp. DR5-3]TYC22758.1 Gfo/Idh/MocA family oxidoreductase [Micromonospora sp. MP36]
MPRSASPGSTVSGEPGPAAPRDRVAGAAPVTGPAPLRLGVVGAGGFATFLTGALRDLPEVTVTVVADPDTDRAARLSGILAARPVPDWRALVTADDVDVVVVATPPAGHAETTLAALRAGRHVFCEKPLAITADEAVAIRDAVAATGRVLVVDHVLRYNPVLRALARLRDRRFAVPPGSDPLLGPVRRLAFENDASDEDLGPEHWFWDERVSGGIFVEHGVHFFDAADALVGATPESVQGILGHRTGADLVDLAVATTRYPDGAVATFAHGFSHAHRCERQLMRIDFGTAEARVTGWIPVHATLDLWTDDAGAALVEHLPARAADLLAVEGHRLRDAAVTVTVHRHAGPADARERGRPRQLPHHCRITLDLGGEAAKPYVYAESVRAAMHDLVRCVRTGDRPAAGVTEGATAVTVAAAAARSAREGRTVHLGRSA